MGAPRKKIHAKPTNLTIDPAVKAESKALAKDNGYSLSEYVERLLAAEVRQAKDGKIKGAPKSD